TWQAQHMGFYSAPALLVAVDWIVLRRLRAGPVALSELDRRLVGALGFALCMFAMLFPRIDTMHLIGALPSVLVLAALAVARLARAWSGILGVDRRVLEGVTVAGAAALALLSTLPSFEGPLTRPQLAIASATAPVSIEAVRGEEIVSLNGVLEFLRARLDPGELLFGFPAVALVPYALGHSTPTPHDYFFPGRPNHGDEVEIIRRLNTVRPRFIVSLGERLGFFSESPAYYFLLRRWVRDDYELVARFGRYEVLARRDLGLDPHVAPETIAPLPPDDPLLGFAPIGAPPRAPPRRAPA